MTTKHVGKVRRIARALGRGVAGLGVLVIGGLVWASVTEAGPLVGEAHDADATVREYAAAEARMFERFDVKVRSHTVTLRDPAIRVHVQEVAGEDPPVVLIHGGGSTLLSWMPLLPHLRGRHLFLVDRPGCGLTDGFEYVGVDLRRHALAVVEGVLDQLHINRAAFVGNSMGGLWSLWFAIEHPARVAALAMAGCPATFLGTSAPTGMRFMALPGVGQAMMRMQPRNMSGTRTALARAAGEHAAAGIDPELLAAVHLSRLIPGAMPSFRSLAAEVLTVKGTKPAYAFSEADLARVHAPMLLLWGRDDVFGAPAAAERARSLHPDISVEIVEGGHLPWLDEPERSGRAIRAFIDAHASGG